MTEKWAEVPGWEGFYAVSTMGRVKSLARSVPGRPGVMINRKERLLKTSPNGDGYPQVSLSRNNKRTTTGVHLLVATTFHGLCPEGMECRHLDGDKSNNDIQNLQWGTRSENTYDRVAHGTHLWARKTHCPAGHPYSPENTQINSKGARQCRTCRKAQRAARRRRTATATAN